MVTLSKKRQTASSIKIDPNVRCLRIYPVEDNANSTKTIANLKTRRDQVIARAGYSPVACFAGCRSGMG
jgi:hypothetical protein